MGYLIILRLCKILFKQIVGDQSYELHEFLPPGMRLTGLPTILKPAILTSNYQLIRLSVCRSFGLSIHI